MSTITATLTEIAMPSGISAAPFALVTPFSAPTQCAESTSGFTMLENDGYRIWLNAILPVPGTTITSCYPSQFISSYLLEQGGIPQAAFSPLVCPSGYSTVGPYTSNYIACCPSGWGGLAPASDAPTDRPAAGGTCYTNIYNVPIKVTVYDDSGIQASSIFTATNTLDQAFAMVYEGFASGVAVLKSTTSMQTITSPNLSPTPSSTPSPTSAIPISTSSSSAPTTTPGAKVSKGAIISTMIGLVIGVSLILASAFWLCRSQRKDPEEAEERDRPPQVPPKHIPWDDYWMSQISQLEVNKIGYNGYKVVKENSYKTPELYERNFPPELDGRARPYEIG